MNERRNANPTPEAILASTLWGREYAAHGGGMMDFWDRQAPKRKEYIRSLLERLKEAQKCHGRG